MTKFNLQTMMVSVFSYFNGLAVTVSLIEMLVRHTQGFYGIISKMRAELSQLVPGTAEWTEKKREWKQRWDMACWTPSCVIREGEHRSDANIEQMNPIVCIDIDFADQKDLSLLDRFKEIVAQLRWVVYAGLSCSGTGFFALCLFDSPDPRRDFKRAYRQISAEFERLGFVVDTTASSLSNYRFVSYDDKPYINLQAEPLQLLGYDPEEAARFQKQPRLMGVVPAQPFPQRPVSGSLSSSQRPVSGDYFAESPEDPYAKVERILREENVSGLSDDYKDWYEVGFAFTDTFGEAGRPLFHLYSATSTKYNPAETDHKYTSLLRSTRHTHTLNTFYHVCKTHGVKTN